jgi:hypothetical protein
MGPYVFAWGRQVANFIEGHAQNGSLVDASARGPVSPYENVTLQVVSGWHE